MTTPHSLQDSLGQIGRTGTHWTLSWWNIARVGSLILVLALSPSTYRRERRQIIAHQLVQGTAPLLPWFALVSALFSLVLIRIVIVTATSYGLTHYAFEMMVRVLVLELIPLSAALFVALYSTLPGSAALIDMLGRGELDAMRQAGNDPLHHVLLPRVIAGIFAVLLLAAVSCVIAMVLAYLAIYGFSFAAFEGFTRTIGQIFNPAITLIFVLKTMFFSFAVSLIPVTAFLRAQRTVRARSNPELESLVRLFTALLVIEAVSLTTSYY